MSTIVLKPSSEVAGSSRVSSLAFLCLFGTGSVYAVDDSARWQHHVQARVPFKVIESQALAVDSTADHISSEIDHVRETLGLSVSELAGLLEVSRQAIYKWLAAKARPEPEKLERLAFLRQVADDFSEAGLATVPTLVRIRAFDGRTLLDLLRAKAVTDAHVRTLIDEGRAMAAAGPRSGLRFSRARPTKDWQSTMGIPGGVEDD